MSMISSVFLFAVIDQSSEGDKTGVTKKLSGQVKGFVEDGLSVTFIRRDDKGYYLSDEHKDLLCLSTEKNEYSYKIKNSVALKLLEYFKLNERPNLLYCRGTRAFKGCRKLFLYLYMHGTKIVIEIPTVTSLLSHRHPKEFIIEAIDRFALYRLHKNLDGYVVMSHEKRLFGHRTIKINNCIDVEKVTLIEPRNHDGIHLLGVAMMQLLHGYERVIEGLHLYYESESKPEDVYLDLVGNGPETSKYKAMVSKYNLQKRVFFHGVLQGKKLDEIYNQSDIGLGAFGLYKSRITEGSVLKLKEYCAKGIPFIYACHEDTLDPEPYFCKLFPNNSSPIDIKEVLKFYHSLETCMDNVKIDMRRYAVERLSWRKEMHHVVEEVERAYACEKNP